MVSHRIRILLASIFGNALEFYNLTLYGFFVAIIGKTFFPSESPLFSLISSLSGYAIGFIVRPLGAIVFGNLGDRLGRRKALGLSIIIMGVPSLIIAILPGYATLGIVAPTLLILCRITQGLCSGGEFNGAIIFALEHLGKNRPGLAGGFIVGSCLLGSLTALGVASLIESAHLPVWGWRLSFLLGGSASFYGLYMRKKIEESPVFALLRKKDQINQNPLKTALSSYGGSCLRVFAIGAFDGAITYTLVTFLGIYTIATLHISPASSFRYNFFGILTCMLACPLFGHWADRYGVKKTLMVSSSMVLIFSLLVFYWVQCATLPTLMMANILLGFLAGSIIGPQPLFSQGLFPANTRYTGIAFSYSLSIGTMGGLTPLILTYWTQEGLHPYAPAFYLMGFAIFFLAVLMRTSIKDA